VVPVSGVSVGVASADALGEAAGLGVGSADGDGDGVKVPPIGGGCEALGEGEVAGDEQAAMTTSTASRS
jgi:hypothetical protein